MKDVADDLALIVRNAIAYIKELERKVQEMERVAETVQECPNCASLQDQNTELDRKLAELETALRAQS